MRIISGTHKGRRIQAPKNLPVRPTTDMAKEALFNILRHKISIHGIQVLELFSGSGNMSYEMCSRGAAGVTAVDAHAACVAFVKKTATDLKFNIQPLKADVFAFLKNHNQQYDLIFADPPYAFTLEEFLQIPEYVFTKNLLKPGGMLIVEHSKHTDLGSHSYFDNARKYGGTVFSFFLVPDEEEE